MNINLKSKYIWRKKRFFDVIRISFRWQKTVIKFLKKPNFTYKFEPKVTRRGEEFTESDRPRGRAGMAFGGLGRPRLFGRKSDQAPRTLVGLWPRYEGVGLNQSQQSFCSLGKTKNNFYKNYLKQLNSLNYESFKILKNGLSQSNFYKKIVEFNNFQKKNNFLFRVYDILNFHTRKNYEYLIKYQLTKNITSPFFTKFQNQDIFRLRQIFLKFIIWKKCLDLSKFNKMIIQNLSLYINTQNNTLDSYSLIKKVYKKNNVLSVKKTKDKKLPRRPVRPEGQPASVARGGEFSKRGVDLFDHLQKPDPIHQNIWFQNFEKSNQNTYFLQRPFSFPFQWIQKGDLLSDCSSSIKGELALGKNLLVAYMPWEGFNFEDAVLINDKVLSKYTSLHISKYDLEIAESGLEKEEITYHIPGISSKNLQKLDKNGIIKIGSWVTEGDILVGRIISIPTETHNLLTHEKLLYDIVIFGPKDRKIQEICLRVPQGVSGRIIRISYTHQKQGVRLVGPGGAAAQGRRVSNPSWAKSKNIRRSIAFSSNNNYNDQQLNSSVRNQYYFETAFSHKKQPNDTSHFINSLKKITIYIAEKREFQIGDKISGRHGNKGIISQIFSNSDMPYFPNGRTLDVLLNPLGVPSRMNVGQILECLLGFTGTIFHTKFRVLCFDEIYGYESSRSFIYSKLFELCKKTRQKWFLSKKTPGKFNLFDGRNGQLFYQSVMVGSTYLMKLIHVVDEKIHARGTGPYSLITQQPLRGRAQHGGQRVGEMEVWALQGFGSASTLQELLTVKSDDLHGRNQIMETLLKNTPLRFGKPEALRVVLRELQCLCLDIQLSEGK